MRVSRKSGYYLYFCLSHILCFYIISRPNPSKFAPYHMVQPLEVGVLFSSRVGFKLEIKMYAVIVSGGKQYRVQEGHTLKLEKLAVEAGSNVEFDRVLLVADGDDVKIGAPVVEGAKVTAEVVSHGRAKKVHIMKFKRRKHHMKQMGHRQHFTEVKITGISA